jgi:hypothetical protein
MSKPDSRHLATVPERIVAYLENSPSKRGVLSLYFDSSTHILEALRDLSEMSARPVIEHRRAEDISMGEVLGPNGSVTIDRSVKLWPRIVGEFSLEELRTLLKMGVFLDIKIFGEQDIKIETD